MSLVHWLSKHTDLVGVIWTSSAKWPLSVSGRLAFVKKRIKRSGFLKATNEALYYLVVNEILDQAGEYIESELVEKYVRQYGSPQWQGASINTNNINSAEVVRFARERTPDLIMAMCVNEFFRREIREVPRLGAFLWHEGIVPEYKGLYSPFWAIHNNEPEMLGYSVLRMNHRFDEGEVYLQGPVKDVNPGRDSPCYIGHKAILDSLPAVAQLYRDLENGTATAISVRGRKEVNYTYPGLTDWIQYRRALQWQAQPSHLSID
jgi:hypothetical protein